MFSIFKQGGWKRGHEIHEKIFIKQKTSKQLRRESVSVKLKLETYLNIRSHSRYI